jgi:hypothetical protein
MGPRHGVVRLIAALAAAGLLGGCGSGSTASTVPPTVAATAVATLTATPVATSLAPATPTAAPTAARYGPVSVITGVENCAVDFGPISGEGTSVQHARNATAKCTDAVNDPRVSGTYTAAWSIDYWGTPDKTNGAIVQWATARLVGPEGAWEGRATGVYSSDRGDRVAFWWTGTGSYAGLTYFELVSGAGQKTVQGEIFPGSPPKPSLAALPASRPTATTPAAGAPTAVPSGSMTALAYGPVSVFSGWEDCAIDFGTTTGEGTTVQHARNGTAKCTDTVTDPRMAGTYTATWNLDYWGTPDKMNGALVQWGAGRLTAAGGAWVGRATGVYSSNGGDTIVWWWTGTGAYAGLTCFELVTGRGPWAIQGQIFPGSPPKP